MQTDRELLILFSSIILLGIDTSPPTGSWHRLLAPALGVWLLAPNPPRPSELAAFTTLIGLDN